MQQSCSNSQLVYKQGLVSRGDVCLHHSSRGIYGGDVISSFSLGVGSTGEGKSRDEPQYLLSTTCKYLPLNRCMCPIPAPLLVQKYLLLFIPVAHKCQNLHIIRTRSKRVR